MFIFFEPCYSNENEYINNIVHGLECQGNTIVNHNISGKIKKRLAIAFHVIFHCPAIFHYNWIENITRKKKLKYRIKEYKYLFFIKFGHLIGLKFCWTMHNKIPHNCDNIQHAQWFYKKWIPLMDMILVHCEESIQILENVYQYPKEKICYVPIGAYSELPQSELSKQDLLKKYNMNEKDLVFLYFGKITSYKNVPILMQSFKELNMKNAHLLICGKIDSSLSSNECCFINELSKCKNITVMNYHIPDDELSELFNLTDLVILPFDKVSMQNSSSAILAFCNKKPVIIPRFGYILDIMKYPFVLSYDYVSSEDHKEKLKAKISETYISYLQDKTTLTEIGEQAYMFTKNELSWNTICRVITSFYQRLKPQ